MLYGGVRTALSRQLLKGNRLVAGLKRFVLRQRRDGDPELLKGNRLVAGLKH